MVGAQSMWRLSADVYLPRLLKHGYEVLERATSERQWLSSDVCSPRLLKHGYEVLDRATSERQYA